MCHRIIKNFILIRVNVFYKIINSFDGENSFLGDCKALHNVFKFKV